MAMFAHGSPHTSSDTTREASLSSTTPSEAPIEKDTYQSTAKDDEPEYLRLPTISTEGFIQKVGVDKHKEIDVPNNINLSGWFSQGSKPGQQGLSIIVGHVDGIEKVGIFHRLASLKKGDQFEVERANGIKLQFRIIALQEVEVASAATILFSQQPGIASQLNLVTCIGTFNSQSKRYDKRLIVSAELL